MSSTRSSTTLQVNEVCWLFWRFFSLILFICGQKIVLLLLFIFHNKRYPPPWIWKLYGMETFVKLKWCNISDASNIFFFLFSISPFYCKTLQGYYKLPSIWANKSKNPEKKAKHILAWMLQKGLGQRLKPSTAPVQGL